MQTTTPVRIKKTTLQRYRNISRRIHRPMTLLLDCALLLALETWKTSPMVLDPTKIARG